jgi:hypothetical protein
LLVAFRFAGWRARASQAVRVCALACAGTAQAQLSRLADEIEWKRLDVHPRPTLLKDPGLGVYGRFDLGLVRREFGTSNEFRCRRERVGTRWAVDSVSRSHVGWRQDAPLGSGLNVHLRLEHSFDASSGKLANDCKVFFDTAGRPLGRQFRGVPRARALPDTARSRRPAPHAVRSRSDAADQGSCRPAHRPAGFATRWQWPGCRTRRRLVV